MPPTPQLKLASETHLEALLPLVQAYHQFENITLNNTQRREAIQKLLSDKSLGRIWLIYVDDIVVGYIALCTGYSIEFAGFDAFIDEFYITPEHRNQGIGKQVLIHIKNEAQKLNIRAIHLEVDRNNTHAKNIYADADFETRDKYVLMTHIL